jgi:hypothetical protein
MIRRKTALRIGALLTLVYVVLGVALVTIGWIPMILQGDPYHRFWGHLPWYKGLPFFIRTLQVWLPLGLFFNTLALIALFRESNGRKCRRLFWLSGCGIIGVTLFELGLVVVLIALSPITVKTSAISSTSWAFYIDDLIGPCLVNYANMIAQLRLIERRAVGTRGRQDPSSPI